MIEVKALGFTKRDDKVSFYLSRRRLKKKCFLWKNPLKRFIGILLYKKIGSSEEIGADDLVFDPHE